MDRIPLRGRLPQMSDDLGEDGGVLRRLGEDEVGEFHVVPVRALKHHGRDTEEVALPPPQRKNGHRSIAVIDNEKIHGCRVFLERLEIGLLPRVEVEVATAGQSRRERFPFFPDRSKPDFPCELSDGPLTHWTSDPLADEETQRWVCEPTGRKYVHFGSEGPLEGKCEQAATGDPGFVGRKRLLAGLS